MFAIWLFTIYNHLNFLHFNIKRYFIFDSGDDQEHDNIYIHICNGVIILYKHVSTQFINLYIYCCRNYEVSNIFNWITHNNILQNILNGTIFCKKHAREIMQLIKEYKISIWQDHDYQKQRAYIVYKRTFSRIDLHEWKLIFLKQKNNHS